MTRDPFKFGVYLTAHRAPEVLRDPCIDFTIYPAQHSWRKLHRTRERRVRKIEAQQIILRQFARLTEALADVLGTHQYCVSNRVLRDHALHGLDLTRERFLCRKFLCSNNALLCVARDIGEFHARTVQPWRQTLNLPLLDLIEIRKRRWVDRYLICLGDVLVIRDARKRILGLPHVDDLALTDQVIDRAA